MTKLILSYAQGNPGALEFLVKLINPKNMDYLIPITFKLEECKTIRGTNLYVLWNDLCSRDISKVFQLCSSCPSNILEDACSKQDYSGITLVSKYL